MAAAEDTVPLVGSAPRGPKAAPQLALTEHQRLLNRRARFTVVICIIGMAILGFVFVMRTRVTEELTSDFSVVSDMPMAGEDKAAQYASEPMPGMSAEVSYTTPTSPHIVLFLIDDAGVNDVGYSSTDITDATPYIDLLAGQGVKLTRYYSEHSCTPARAALLSGASPNVIGAQHEVIDISDEWGLDVNHKLIPAHLAELGYATHLVGKWDIGHYAPQYWPTQRGFHTYFGMLGCCFDKFKHKQHGVYDVHTDLGPQYVDYKTVFGTYMWQIEALRVIDDYDETSKVPVFLMVSFDAPHAQTTIPDGYNSSVDYLQAVKGAGYEVRKNFAANMRLVDNAVAGVMKALDTKGMAKDMVVVLTSDNGAPSVEASDPNGGSNFPYRGMKGTSYEGGVRVPALVYSPLLPSAVQGSSVDALFHVTDLLPTFVMGVAGGKVDSNGQPGYGHNQWDVITGASTQGARNEISFLIDYLGGNMGALIVGDFKFLHAQTCYEWFSPVDGAAYGLKEGSCEGDGSDSQFTRQALYNLRDDPYEQHNLYDNDKFAEELNQLTNRFCYYRTVVSNSSQYRPDNYTAMENALAYQATGGVSSGFLNYWRDEPHTDVLYPISETSCGTCTGKR